LSAFSLSCFHNILEFADWKFKGGKFMSLRRSHNSIWFWGLGLVVSSPSLLASISQESSTVLPTKHKSLLFDQSFDEAPVRPFLAEELIKKYVEVALAPQRAPASQEKQIKRKASELENAVTVASSANVEIKIEATSKIETEPAHVAMPVFHKAAAPIEITETQTKEILEVLIEKGDVVLEKRSIKKPQSLVSQRASVLVLDEAAFLESKYERVPNARVHWLHPNSQLSSAVGKDGIAALPYPQSHSARFVVTAEGYLPAVGYATRGLINPVLLYKENRIGPILKTLNRSPKRGESLLLGRFLNRKLAPIAKMSFDDFARETRNSFYSMGAIGLFHQAARESGPMGDFLIPQLSPSLQYLLSKQSLNNVDFHEWPAQLLDLKGLSPILTTTLLEPVEKSMSTQVLDAFHLSRPSAGVYATIGGQRGLVEPDASGILDLHDMSERPNVDLIEIHAQGYLKTWLNTPAVSKTMPDVVTLFTSAQLSEVLKSVGESVSFDKTYVVGAVRAEDYNDALRVQIYNAEGKIARQAKVHYFGDNNRLGVDNSELKLTDPRFVVTGLPEGEFHMVLTDLTHGHGQSIQVFRTQQGTVTQIQF
jgi:hypothetical protein